MIRELWQSLALAVVVILRLISIIIKCSLGLAIVRRILLLLLLLKLISGIAVVLCLDTPRLRECDNAVRGHRSPIIPLANSVRRSFMIIDTFTSKGLECCARLRRQLGIAGDLLADWGLDT